MYCSLDKIDLIAEIDGRSVAIQIDHRSSEEIEAEPELSALYAMARVLNARGHLVADGNPGAAVRYVLEVEPPPALREALVAAGAVLERGRVVEPLGDASEAAVAELTDRAFATLARRAAQRVGVRDLAVALRMLEDQTIADPPPRHDEAAYWARVLELAALTGELLRARAPQGARWVQTERALVPFGFQLASGADGAAAAVLFPTNRAQRVIEDGSDESLFKLLLAADETLQRPLDAPAGRLMPSLRDRRMVEIDEVLWRPLLPEATGAELPIVVCGLDGESTFGMLRRGSLRESASDALDEALRNLADEEVQTELYAGAELSVLAVTGSFYAAEKLLDQAFMRGLHGRLAADLLAAAVPARGLLLVTAAHREPVHLARFSALAQLRFEAGGGRAISPVVLLVSDGQVAGFVRDATAAVARSAGSVDQGPDSDDDDDDNDDDDDDDGDGGDGGDEDAAEPDLARDAPEVRVSKLLRRLGRKRVT